MFIVPVERVDGKTLSLDVWWLLPLRGDREKLMHTLAEARAESERLEEGDVVCTKEDVYETDSVEDIETVREELRAEDSVSERRDDVDAERRDDSVSERRDDVDAERRDDFVSERRGEIENDGDADAVFGQIEGAKHWISIDEIEANMPMHVAGRKV